jgi:hypothetical protein
MVPHAPPILALVSWENHSEKFNFGVRDPHTMSILSFVLTISVPGETEMKVLFRTAACLIAVVLVDTSIVSASADESEAKALEVIKRMDA